MLQVSEQLRTYVADSSADELHDWAAKRVRGEDNFPMLYYGKEAEKPQEALAAALSLPDDVLTGEKRGAMLRALREIRKELLDWFLTEEAGVHEKELCDRWAEVIDLARPQEMQKEARFLLRAAQEALPQTRMLLPALAAAATAYEEKAEGDSSLWLGLLKFPETAALAFQRLLRTESVDAMTEVWIELYRKKFSENWPCNMRLLTVSLLGKAPTAFGASVKLAEMLQKQPFGGAVREELYWSRNWELQSLAMMIGSAAGTTGAIVDPDPERFIANLAGATGSD